MSLNRVEDLFRTNAFAVAFKKQFEKEVREHLENVVLQISKPVVDRAVRSVVDHMTVCIEQNWRDFTTDFCVLIRDERNLKRD